MKYFFLLFLVLPNPVWAKSPCVSPKEAQLSKSLDVSVPKTKYSVEICYLVEKVKNGAYEEYYKDLIVLKKDGAAIANCETKIPITVGRIGDLVFERASNRFIAVTYGAGEFCNGIVIFDTKLKKVAIQKGCLSASDECHVIDLNESNCKAKIECRDKGAEGEPPVRKEPISQTISLCK